MAEFALRTPTAVPVGSSVPFDTVLVCGCNCIRHRAGSGNIRVKGGSCCNPYVYKVNFHGNVTGFTGQFRAGIFLDGELLPETEMSIYTGLATVIQSIDAETEIKVDGCNSNISVRVIEGDDATFNTASIIVQREA